MAIKTLLAVYITCILTTVQSAIVNIPRSPCPGVFSYNTSSLTSTNSQTPDRWLGEILVKADTTLSGFWIDVELDKPAHLLGNYLAEVTSNDNREFKIQDLDRRLAKGSITPVKIYVKYDVSSLPPPAVRVIRLNGRQICPPDHEEELDVEPVRTPSYVDPNYSARPQSSTHRTQNVYEEPILSNRPQTSSTHTNQNSYDQQNRPQTSTHKTQNVYQANKGYDQTGTRGTSAVQTSNQQNSSQSSKKNQNTRVTSYDDLNTSSNQGTSTQSNHKNTQNTFQNSGSAIRGTSSQTHHQPIQPSITSQKQGISQSSNEDTSTRGTMKVVNKPQSHQTTSLLKGSTNQQGFHANSRPSNNAYDEVGIRAGELLAHAPVEKSTSAPLPRTLSTMSVNNHNSRTTQTTRQESGHRITQPTRATYPDRHSEENTYEDTRNTNRDRTQTSWNKDTIDRGTQTTSSQYDDEYSGSRGTQTHRGGNRQPEPSYGDSRDDVYSSGSNRDRTPSRDPYDQYEREKVGIRGSEPEFTDPRPNNRDRDRNTGFRQDPNRNSDFDIESPHRENSGQGTRGSNRDWEDENSGRRGSQPHRGSGSNNYDRDETTIYTSLDSHIQRPTYTTTERYQGYPITPHPSSQNRPGHTPLINSNIRPSEPSSSDYYEWGVRRTSSKRTQLPAPQPNTDRRPEQCGKVAIQPVALISRGTPTRSGDYPWHAAIYRPEGIDLRYICGATLVSLSTLVTAAHCVTRQSTGRAVKPDSLVVYLGKHSLRRWTGNEQTATVSEVIVHPAYNHTAFQADLALLKLSTPVTYNDYVRPVCLWDRRRKSIESVVARRGTVVGWGYDEYQVVTDELMQAHMPVVPKLDCIHSYPTFFSRFVTDLTYCAGFRNGTTACNGDSGGGMVFLEESLDPEDGTDGVWRLRGVVSIGVSITEKFVCDYNHYIVFTDVAQFLPWLENNM